jgi:hypothetical protein
MCSRARRKYIFCISVWWCFICTMAKSIASSWNQHASCQRRLFPRGRGPLLSGAAVVTAAGILPFWATGRSAVCLAMADPGLPTALLCISKHNSMRKYVTDSKKLQKARYSHVQLCVFVLWTRNKRLSDRGLSPDHASRVTCHQWYYS